jgi:molybdenum cofactor synthesis domain-containing protein
MRDVTLVAASTATRPTASVVTVGEELLRGDVVDTNGTEAARMVTEAGYWVRVRHCVPDEEQSITDAVREGLGRDGIIVVTGGLGPTSDDVTRFGVAQALGSPLEHREEAWQAVVRRLTQFDLPVHEDNRRQALMPTGARLLPNPNGTAWGAVMHAGATRVVMVPGPPKECLPMLRTVLGQHKPPRERMSWRTLGLIEADAAARVDALLSRHAPDVKASFRWSYPFVDVTIDCPPSDFSELGAQIERALDGHVVSRTERTAIQELAGVLDGRSVTVDDRLTGGVLTCVLEDMGSVNALETEEAIPVILEGDWDRGSRHRHTGTLTVRCRVGPDTYHLALPNRGPEVLDAAVEFAAWSLLRSLVVGE